jgi:predicted lipoprotein with Yx(FWY)xxD motif
MRRLAYLAVPLLLLATTAMSLAQTTTTVGVRSTPDLGSFLTTPDGRTLYTYTGDTTGVSNVSGQLLANWPAFTASAPLTLPSGVGGALSLITRSDGSQQVAYNGLPLYTFVRDTAPNVVNGQNVGGFVVAKAQVSSAATATPSAAAAPTSAAAGPAPTAAAAAATAPPAPTAVAPAPTAAAPAPTSPPAVAAATPSAPPTPSALPNTGQGPDSGSGSVMALLVAVGAALLGAGAYVRRRMSSS